MTPIPGPWDVCRIPRRAHRDGDLSWSGHGEAAPVQDRNVEFSSTRSLPVRARFLPDPCAWHLCVHALARSEFGCLAIHAADHWRVSFARDGVAAGRALAVGRRSIRVVRAGSATFRGGFQSSAVHPRKHRRIDRKRRRYKVRRILRQSRRPSMHATSGNALFQGIFCGFYILSD